MRTISSILLGKAVFKLSRFLKRGGGSAAPGLYALKISPNLIEELTSKIPANILITGTNGKTTTSKILAHFAKKEGLRVIRNHTGSNLERGIASTLIANYSLTPKPDSLDLGIWETDEAAFNSIAPKIKPKIIIFLNVFRDQLDRYGEVDSVLKKWGETLKKIDKKTIILVNGDDVNTKKLKNYFKGGIYTFGLKDHKIIGEGITLKKEVIKLDFEAKNIKLKNLSSSSFQLSILHSQWSITLPLPGIYHIYDFLAAFAAGHKLGFKIKNMISSINSFSPAFGRVEKLDFGYIFLIKNPVGATEVFKTIAPQLQKTDRLLLVLNDNLADGTDVSWIWDSEFERLFTPSLRASAKQSIFVSGTRAYDLANRLKYAGFQPTSISTNVELETALQQARRGLKGRLFILPTYTAMLELQALLVKQGIKKNYWEEQ